MTTGYERHTIPKGRSRRRGQAMEQSVPDNDILAPPPLGSDKPEVHPIMKGARHLLLRKLRNRDYESSLVLLAALVETRRFTISFYWKVKPPLKKKKNCGFLAHSSSIGWQDDRPTVSTTVVDPLFRKRHRRSS